MKLRLIMLCGLVLTTLAACGIWAGPGRRRSSEREAPAYCSSLGLVMWLVRFPREGNCSLCQGVTQFVGINNQLFDLIKPIGASEHDPCSFRDCLP